MIASLSAEVRDRLADLEGFLGEFTVLDWVLIALGAAAIWWMVARLRAATSLGPIEVEQIDHDAPEGTPVPVLELTTLLRERLATSGLLPPPAVPAAKPQTGVVAAVEASPVPQAKWLAALLEAVGRFAPHAPSYRLKGTLIGDDQSGIRIWLCPVGKGHDLFTTVEAEGDAVDAVEEAAARVFRHITHDAVDVFPHWTRWNGTVALRAYLQGVDRRNEGKLDEARVAFARAASLDRRNVLPRLALANLEELGYDDSGPSVAERASALGRYLEIAEEQPGLVEARYRASVLAAMLAPECADPAAWQVAAARLGAATDELPARLARTAAEESDAVMKLVKPLHVAIHHHRPRHRFEPRGRERRQLRRTVAISRHCLRLRTLPPGDRSTHRWRRAKMLWLRSADRRSVGWQAHYNAGCFYSLLAGRGVGTDDDRRRWRATAFRELYRAIEEGGGKPDPRWLEHDPDLHTLREEEGAEWDRLVGRHHAESAPKRRLAQVA